MKKLFKTLALTLALVLPFAAMAQEETAKTTINVGGDESSPNIAWTVTAEEEGDGIFVITFDGAIAEGYHGYPMTDFSALISQPRLMLIGAAAQIGIFGAYVIALHMGFTPAESGAIGIIGGADGPTAIFLSSKLAPHQMGAIAVSAYSYMALVPVIQRPIMLLLTTKKERLIRMAAPRPVSQKEKIIFPIVGFILTAMIVPSGMPLLGMLFFGNLLKESGVTKRLAETARGPLIDVVTILIGITVGCSTQADEFLTGDSIKIFLLGLISFVIATACGVLFVKFMNLFCKEGRKINPLIGNAGVSAVPDAARVSQNVGREFDKNNHLLMHAMAPNVAGVIGSAVAAGILLSFLG